MKPPKRIKNKEYLISSRRNTSLLLYKELTIRSMRRLTCRLFQTWATHNFNHKTRNWLNTKMVRTSAWYSNFSVGGGAWEEESDAAALDSFRYAINQLVFMFNWVKDPLFLDCPLVKDEYHLDSVSLLFTS